MLFCVKKGENTLNPRMVSFFGEYEVSVDAKGRFLVPASLRKQIPEGAEEVFVINRGIENCLNMYHISMWKALTGKLNTMNDFDDDVREFKRVIMDGATMIEPDSAGRILMPKSLMEHADIKKDMVLVSLGNKIELWDKDTHKEYMNKRRSNIKDLAKKVGGGVNLFENL